MTNKRVRGIAIHRPLLIGSTATPLTPAEKMSADPLHTHKWTVAVRSAASNPLPTHLFDDAGAPLPPTTTATPSTGAAAGTRGRDTETDYHKHIGGKDDISHFVRRVQFKLHDSFPQPVRTCDRPPYQVTETGWGEFEVQIKIWWVAESGEKPLQTFHYLKLHPWNPLPTPASAVSETGTTASAAATTAGTTEAAATAPPAEGAGAGVAAAGAPQKEGHGEAIAGRASVEDVTTQPKAAVGSLSSEAEKPAESSSEPKPVEREQDAAAAVPSSSVEQAPAPTAGGTSMGEASSSSTLDAAPAPKPSIALPPVVHSWQYDEVVFPEPTEAMQETFRIHPPTPLPTTASQAFTDPKTSRLQHGFQAASSSQPQPPYPLHAPSSQPYLYGISQASMQAEADRLDIARIEAVRELEKERNRLIEAERELRRVRQKTESLMNAGGGGGASAAR
ncbi:yeats-domain-containing protein [Jaminaea rosea]|uniref:Protein AF-9 homolog n=1 Tax=Jaminaea rosea TaxID=1569628 RepID=A0A316UTD6_9BASI|nr:yeats-domain-containing protein [Jaminaea rosea]PWN28522.1 yeats-domain-containing protein [Jaminaea rosea]